MVRCLNGTYYNNISYQHLLNMKDINMKVFKYGLEDKISYWDFSMFMAEL